MRKDIFRKPTFHLVLIALLGLLVYSNTFNIPFQFDDTEFVADNPIIKDIGYYISPSKADSLKYSDNPDILRFLKTRPVSYLSLWANHRLGGLDVTGYHVVNTAVHVINALLVYLIVMLTFRTPFMSGSPPPTPSTLKEEDGEEKAQGKNIPLSLRRGGKGEGGSYIALFSGLLFVAHPVQTMAVTYILQRWASLAAMFYMLSIVLYVRWRLGASVKSLIGINSNREFGFRRKRTYSLYYTLSLFSCILAMKTKELAFTLPLMVVLYEFLFFTPLVRRAAGEIKRRTLYLAPFITTMLIIPYSYINLNIDAGEASDILSGATSSWGAPSRLDYFLSQFGVIATYIRILFLPIGQSMYYEDIVRHSFLEPGVFLPFLFLLAVFGLGIFLFFRSRITHHALRLCTFGIFWFFLALSVESSVFPIGDMVVEYRVYLPSAGAFMAIVSGAFYLADGFGRRGRKAVVCAACAGVVALSGAAYARNTVWQSRTGLWEDTVRKAPGNASGHFWLGKAYFAEGLMEKAIGAYKECIELKPDYGEANINLGLAYIYNGTPDKGIEHYLKASESILNHHLTYNNLGLAYSLKGMAKKAIDNFQTAIKMQPDYAEAYHNLGNVYIQTAQYDNAIRTFDKVLEINPYLAGTYHSLGYSYYMKGNIDKAIKYYKTVLGLQPGKKNTHFALGLAYQKKGLIDKAQEHFQKAN
jgi:Tfp pilus assembly protein PilF